MDLALRLGHTDESLDHGPHERGISSEHVHHKDVCRSMSVRVAAMLGKLTIAECFGQKVGDVAALFI